MKRAFHVVSLALAICMIGLHSANAEGWSVGKLWPTRAVKKVGTGTKRAFYKTKQALSFKEDPPPSQFSAWRGQQEYRRTESKPEKPGLFSSLFKPSDPPRPSKTIKDFMNQERVEP